MKQAERERRHRLNLQRIQHVQQLVGVGDRARIDHEGTLIEQARMFEEEICSHRATEAGLEALSRLVRLVEEGMSRDVRDTAVFIAAVRDGAPLPLRTLRGIDVGTADDMVAVLDAFRWGRVSLVENVEGGAKRVARALDRARQRG
ncbi:MAG: hypothetical protein K0R89_450 [Ramlibacter sp.]|jgi:hypothetical protein|nr:hypothetical protein [Ramlibacter sp.]MCD6076512.1 hypothetical protein [Ramlibacter sp.]